MDTNQIKKITNKDQDYIITVNSANYIIDNYYYSCLMPYVGKVLTNDLLKELMAFSDARMILKKYYKKIFLHSISSYELNEILKTKNILDYQIKLIFNRLKEEDLLNDEDFVNYYFDDYKQKRGKLAFKKFLLSKKIDEKLIEKTLELYDEDENLVLKYANDFLKNKTGSTLMLKQKVYTMLTNKGFMDRTIEKVFTNLCFEDEKKSLAKEIKRYLLKYPNDNYKIISKLVYKGYNVKKIKEILMEEGSQIEN